MRKLFLLEDDLSLISGLTFAFKKQGFALDTARTLAEAEVLWSDRKYDLLVLDVSLPDGSGFDFCQKVRRTSNVPILFLTASDEEMNIIMGLELGGDDYLTKPFALEELEARVRTLLRREFRQRESLVQVGALTLNTVTREVSGRGEPLPLTPREFAILEHLMLHRGCWISQEELMEHIWEADANPFSNAVRMHISSLRKKLRKRLGHDPIQTKVGRGYRLAGEETA